MCAKSCVFSKAVVHGKEIRSSIAFLSHIKGRREDKENKGEKKGRKENKKEKEE